MHEVSNSGEELLWYFAYGSNMSSAKFRGSRGIVPLATARVRVPGWVLALNIPGLPYSEPTFTSIAPRTPSNRTTLSVSLSTNSSASGSETETEAETEGEPEPDSESGRSDEIPDVVGVAYLITASQYCHVLGSEGGGIAYEDIQVDAVPVDEKDREQTGARLKVRTLGAAIERYPPPRPSKRYMALVTTGAQEAQLPRPYQTFLDSIAVYDPPRSRRGKIGAALFLSIWGPVMGWMEKITKGSLREDGYAPMLVIGLVRAVMVLIWVSHDGVFAPVFGRGDGVREGVGEGEVERSGLLDVGEKGVGYMV